MRSAVVNSDTEYCCPESTSRIVTRVILSDLDTKSKFDFIRGRGASSQKIVEYKALSRLNGNTRRKHKIDSNGIMSTKANFGRQLGSTLLSTFLPGDTGPIRSPIRSATYRTITPGFGGSRGGSRPGQNRGYRCPEGYQYGGRFTDNRLSTCGAKLFDIPSALGATIRAIRSAGTSGLPSTVQGRTVTGGPIDSSLISSRKPQITRVGNENRRASSDRVKALINEIGQFNLSSNTKARRMVRRDGFVLEPVVPTKVLRAIPDNRDMEGAYYLMSTLSSSDLGGEELGLLSNTGIKSLIYVLPGGSTISLSKARNLSVGERRKLGRVVNSAQKINNSKDPGARLRNVADEIGNGIQYSESFDGIKNPNEIIDGTTAWAKKLFGKRKLQKLPKEEQGTSRTTVSLSERGKLISNLDDAISFIADGGSFSRIAPAVLAKLLANQQLVRKERISNSISAVESGAEKYFVYEKPKNYQHLAERFASDLQQHLGMESPDVVFIGKPNDKRKYLRQDVESAVPGGVFNPNQKFENLDIADVARMLVSDFLTDQRSRPASSIYPIDTADGTRAVLADNTTSGLIDLSKIEITKRMKMRLDDFYGAQLTPAYSDYYQKLRAEQRVLFMKLLSQMINRAKSFNSKKFTSDMNGYGMSAGEKIHLNIISKLFDSRLDVLQNQKQVLRGLISGGSK